MSSRVAFFIYSDKQIRTFIESEFLSELEKVAKVDVFIYSSKTLSQRTALADLHFLPGPGSLFERMGTLLASSRLWRDRMKSRAHYFRATASFGKISDRTANSTMILYNMEGWTEVKRALIRFVGNSPYFSSALNGLRMRYVKWIFPRNMKKAGIDLLSYQYAMIPFSGLLSSEFDDLVESISSMSIHTVAVQENWDNLSSKTFINSKPNYFLVWGEQSAGHVKSIHNLSDTKTFIIGSPRFLPYNNSFKSSLNAPSVMPPIGDGASTVKRPYVLFTGTGDGIDDEFILRETMHILFTLNSEKTFSLIYRPHPFTRNRISSEFENEIQQLGVLFDASLSSRSVFHHCPLVTNAELVINQFSTMLLEALTCNVKVLLPTFVSRQVNYDYSGAINEWHHFMGLRMIPNVFISLNSLDYRNDLKRALISVPAQSANIVSWMIDSRPSKNLLCEFHKVICKNT